jgi:predicted lipid-binding transport protein (Tim44 family)
VFDIYTIIFLAIAVFIFLRLRSVLGQRTGRERPPFDPYSAKRNANDRPAGTDKVITLQPRSAETLPAEPPPRPRETEPAAAAGPAANISALEQIAAADKGFDQAHFVTGAKAAYEMIVMAYAEGDRKSLKNLLARDVYDGFESVISERETRGETAETRFVSIDQADIIGAELRGRTAQVTVRFVSHLISSTKDKNGTIIAGSADSVTSVTDIWTFARDISSRDPNWKLVATEAGH